jgi:2-keto-4-pentenoate hydratase/2-oxohepta-3-ene-1,7-dioic acid hydratase in catechol pathway
MGFRFANVAGRAALIHGDHYFDVSTLSDGCRARQVLAHGDVVVTTIDGIGEIVNRCVRVSDHRSPGD